MVATERYQGLSDLHKLTVHAIRKISSTVSIATKPKVRRCIAIDETKLKVKAT